MSFWKKDKKNEVRSEPRAQDSASRILKPDDAFAAFRPDAQVPMKVWLPEPVDAALKQLTDISNQSRAEYIREMLFIYVYGHIVLEQMRQQMDGLFYRKSRPLYSRTGNRAPALGKNSINYKVWLPVKLRDDLQALAAGAGITLSHFVREVLISAVLGHLTLPVRASVLHQAQETPDDWPLEEGEEE